MNRRTLFFALWSLLSITECFGQKSVNYFNTLGVDQCSQKTEYNEEEKDDGEDPELSSCNDTCNFNQDAVGQPCPAGMSSVNSTDNESKELNFENLVSVLGEVGISNKLFVLAQALLETGNFKSNACKQKHNLFGLYNSKRREYYRFARWEDSVVAYKNMIQYRYKGGNYLHFLRRIGYAEDPRYITKVAQVARNIYKQYFAR